MAKDLAAQGHRFDIVENVGCIPSSANTALSWVLIWQILIVPFTVLVIYGRKYNTFSDSRKGFRVLTLRQSSHSSTHGLSIENTMLSS